MSDFSGSYTNSDGQRIIMTSGEAEAMWKRVEDERANRAAEMPDEQSALEAMCRAFTRLEELGWRNATYCPKDGSMFKVIEAGSTGVFDCTYNGKWPNGSWLLFDGGDVWPSRPILFKLLPEAQAAYDAKMAAAREHYQSMREGK